MEFYETTNHTNHTNKLTQSRGLHLYEDPLVESFQDSWLRCNRMAYACPSLRSELQPQALAWPLTTSSILILRKPLQR